MHDPVEEMFEPIHRKSREVNAPLLERLNVSADDLERLASCVAARPDLVTRELKLAVGMTALRGATRL